jgi:hypothetical protein
VAAGVQPGLREQPPPVRDRKGPAVHASRPNRVTWTIVLRVLAVATMVAFFLCLFGPFRSVSEFFERAAQIFAYSWIGSLLGLVSARLVSHTRIWDLGYWVVGIATGLAMAPPMAVVVWIGNTLADGRMPPMHVLPQFLWNVALVSVGSSIMAVLVNRRSAGEPPPVPPKFLERLPLKLRGAEVWAVEAEDHYLRLHTSKGQDLILMRLSDAARELEGIEGMQVHRSWWVARDAIADARRGDGRATLTLKDGAQVPVSRTYAAQLREKGWI